MVGLDWLINPIVQNWVTILVTSLVTLLAAVVSNYGIKKRFKSVKEKDRQQALEELRSAIEDLIINNRDKITDQGIELDKIGLSSDRIYDLIDAAEREHQVSLSEVTSPVSLLQDVDLRIKNSRYLDSGQKYQYSCAITTIIDKIKDDSSNIVLPEELAETIERIEEEATYDGVEEDIDELLGFIHFTEDIYSDYQTYYNYQRRLLVLLTMVATAVGISSTLITEGDVLYSPENIVVVISALLTVLLLFTLIKSIEENNELDGLIGLLFK